MDENSRYEIDYSLDSAHMYILGNPGRQTYPWPTEYRRSQLDGELAERICRAMEEPVWTPVFIEEQKSYGGYSEYTQEHTFEHTIYCGDSQKSFRKSDGTRYSGLEELLQWLDEKAP